MKKLLYALLFLMMPAVSALAQDIITKRDGTDVLAKVLEITGSQVRYKNWNNLEGPDYVIDKSKVALIRYENGSNEVFQQEYNSERSAIFCTNPDILAENMRYSDLKRLYRADDYYRLYNPRYSLGRPWLNLIFPGLAQMTMKEGGLGAGFLIGDIACGALLITGAALSSSSVRTTTTSSGTTVYINSGRQALGSVFLAAGYVGSITLTVTSIVNAYKVAKVKSLYYSDMDTVRQNYSVNFGPAVIPTLTPQGNLYAAAGLGVRVNF